jgi:lactate dehydrogenase-like 2-hydroxyacid dehydrogenase
MLAVSRTIPQADRHVREGRWEATGRCRSRARCLAPASAWSAWAGSGRRSRSARSRFRMEVAYTARSAKSSCRTSTSRHRRRSAAESDFLVVITPGGAGTRKLIDASVFKALGRKGFDLNVARGR